jgi:hypothetical protein
VTQQRGLQTNIRRIADDANAFSPEMLFHMIKYFNLSKIIYERNELNFETVMILKGEPDSVVGIAPGYGLDDQGVEVQVPVG